MHGPSTPRTLPPFSYSMPHTSSLLYDGELRFLSLCRWQLVVVPPLSVYAPGNKGKAMIIPTATNLRVHCRLCNTNNRALKPARLQASELYRSQSRAFSLNSPSAVYILRWPRGRYFANSSGGGTAISDALFVDNCNIFSCRSPASDELCLVRRFEAWSRLSSDFF